MADIASAGHEAYALDFPGFGKSGGRLSRTDASVPALARSARRFLDTVGVTGDVTVAGHDIGGAVAQHLAASEASVKRLVLMNSVLYNSWPVPAVERFRDQTVADAITVDELLEARAQSLARGVARPLSDAEREAWLVHCMPRTGSARGRPWPAPRTPATPSTSSTASAEARACTIRSATKAIAASRRAGRSPRRRGLVSINVGAGDWFSRKPIASAPDFLKRR